MMEGFLCFFGILFVSEEKNMGKGNLGRICFEILGFAF